MPLKYQRAGSILQTQKVTTSIHSKQLIEHSLMLGTPGSVSHQSHYNHSISLCLFSDIREVQHNVPFKISVKNKIVTCIYLSKLAISENKRDIQQRVA